MLTGADEHSRYLLNTYSVFPGTVAQIYLSGQCLQTVEQNKCFLECLCWSSVRAIGKLTNTESKCAPFCPLQKSTALMCKSQSRKGPQPQTTPQNNFSTGLCETISSLRKVAKLHSISLIFSVVNTDSLGGDRTVMGYDGEMWATATPWCQCHGRAGLIPKELTCFSPQMTQFLLQKIHQIVYMICYQDQGTER